MGRLKNTRSTSTPAGDNRSRRNGEDILAGQRRDTEPLDFDACLQQIGVEIEDFSANVAGFAAEAWETRNASKRMSQTVTSIANSPSWRLLQRHEPLMQRASRLARGIQRRRITFRCEPAYHLTDLGDHFWRSEGNDPQFRLVPPSSEYPDGWVHLRARFLSSLDDFLTPCLYFDTTGDGFGPNELALPLERDPLGQDATVDCVLLLPSGLRGLRLDPATTVGIFRLLEFSVTEISEAEATAKLLWARAGDVTDGPAERLYWATRTTASSVKRNAGETVAQYLLRKAAWSDRACYANWVEEYDTLTAADVAEIKSRIAELSYRPLISVVMPVYDVNTRWLAAAIDSVKEQIYPNWELCIADDASRDGRVRQKLREYMRSDTRIKVEFRSVNGNISAASNSALELAEGEYIALMDHDDVLPKHALYMVAEELNRHPEANLLYSDEDKLSETNSRFDPYFKSDWNPDLFYSHNMISHLGVYRTALVRELGGFRLGFEGSQDYDLALRVIERSSPQHIRHIPHILYHWRAISGSVALAPQEKEYAHTAARRAVASHLQRLDVDAEVTEASIYCLHRVRYPIPKPPPLVSIIIPTRDAIDLLAVCVESVLKRTNYECYEILVVDNNSSEIATRKYFEKLQREKRASVLRYAKQFNFSAINNFAAGKAKGSVLVFLNNDTKVISRDWLHELVSHALRPDVGAVGAMLYHGDDTIQHAGVVLGLGGGVAATAFAGLRRGAPGHIGRAVLQQTYSAVTAACMAVRRDLFEEIEGFDENLAVAYNDVDLCLRLREKGLRNIWTPFAELYHFESSSRGADVTDEGYVVDRLRREQEAMKERWGEALLNDPYYNPNLTLDDSRFGLAFPPRVEKPWR